MAADSDEEAGSTIPSADSGTNGWERGLRLTSTGLIGALVLAGLVGVLGVRTGTATAAGNGLSMSVTHAAVTRPGLATPLGVRVMTDDGSSLPASITTRIESSYLAMFDENGLAPEPSSSFQSDEWTWWTFDIPDGARTFEVSFDARLEPAVQWGEEATAAIEVGGEEVLAVDFTTWVLP